eukprot:TRINITY_DN10341_c0_g1_i2.p1 TRINITY_DN10341_c0_g1~~TRINITY_DN10341_c0_g1_i2.p1  ORF type:complete len:384 (+),score=84.30 TRINITY_DN10341_c0_g1_i2:179-1330(+)
MIVEARALVLKELNEERDALQKGKERIMSQIDRERKNLAAERETLNYFKQRLFESDRPDDAIINLNVGGEKISSMQGTLTSCPGSTLSAMFSGTEFPGAKDKDGCCFIDRNPKFFRMILEFLRANVTPELDNPQEEAAFRKEVDYFGLTNWIYPPVHPPPVLQKIETEGGAIKWQFRCDVNEIKKDSFYTSPDFLQSGDRWRMLFTERCSFLSVYLHNVDAGLMAANWEGLPTVLTISLKNNDEKKTTVKTIRHTFTRRSPDIGLNYFMLMEGLRANKGGFLVTSQAQSKDEEAKPEIIFELIIEKPVDTYMGQPVDKGDRMPSMMQSAVSKASSAMPQNPDKRSSMVKTKRSSSPQMDSSRGSPTIRRTGSSRSPAATTRRP